jgi:hypothetical protein
VSAYSFLSLELIGPIATRFPDNLMLLLRAKRRLRRIGDEQTLDAMGVVIGG